MKLIDAFMCDDIRTTGGVPCYEIEEGSEVMYLEASGSIKHIQAQLNPFPVPLVPQVPDTDIERVIALMLLRARPHVVVKSPKVDVRKVAEKTLNNSGVVLHRVLTHRDHEMIPPGIYVAVTEPEFLGRYVRADYGVGVFLSNVTGVLCFQTPTAFN